MTNNFFKNLGIGEISLVNQWINDKNNGFKEFMYKRQVGINDNLEIYTIEVSDSIKILNYLLRFNPELPDYIKFKLPWLLDTCIFRFQNISPEHYLNILNKYSKHLIGIETFYVSWYFGYTYVSGSSSKFIKSGDKFIKDVQFE